MSNLNSRDVSTVSVSVSVVSAVSRVSVSVSASKNITEN